MRALIADLFETMEAENGIGLAAPQVGHAVRIVVMDLDSMGISGTRRALINPVIVDRHGRERGREGCLSVPGIEGEVTRARGIEVAAEDERGRAVRVALEGIAARVIQHEMDHLDGVLFVDRLSPWAKAVAAPKLAALARRTRRGGRR
jgi:peptide deformylase